MKTFYDKTKSYILLFTLIVGMSCFYCLSQCYEKKLTGLFTLIFLLKHPNPHKLEGIFNERLRKDLNQFRTVLLGDVTPVLFLHRIAESVLPHLIHLDHRNLPPFDHALASGGSKQHTLVDY